MVFSKCRVLDLLDVDFQKYFGAFNRIKFKQADFVVVRKGDGGLACTIALAGELHERFGKESLFLDEVFFHSGINLDSV